MTLGQLYPAQQSALRSLVNGGISFMVFGGMAIRFLGGRKSEDLDIWIRSSASNLDRLEEALSLNSCEASKVVEHLSKPRKKVNYGRGVELFSSVNDLPFSDVDSRMWRMDLGELKVPTMSVSDLILCKEAALVDEGRAEGHEKDRDDLRFLRLLQQQARGEA